MKLPPDARRSLQLYNSCFPFAFTAMLPGLAVRLLRRGNYQHGFAQRFGCYSPEVRARLQQGGRIWIQSISVGETMVALKIARKIKALQPEAKVVISATTSTGFALAAKEQSDWLEAIYNPLDAPQFVRRALDLIAPSQLIIIEGMWPNLLAMAKQRNIPTSLVARLSPRSEARFKKFRWLTGPIFRLIDCIFLQEPEDIARWEELGAKPSQLHCIGGVKFDLESSAATSREPEFRQLLGHLGADARTPVLLAGSTFPGEEALLGKVLLSLRKDFPELLLILVPRHVERTPEIVRELQGLGLEVVLRTELASREGEAPAEPSSLHSTHASHAPAPIEPANGKRENGACPPAPRALIVNTTGELRDWYRVASVAFLGKSICSTGGQNPVEPAAIGKPVLFGPHMENFRAIVASLLQHRAAIQVRDAGELENKIRELLGNEALRASISGNAVRAVEGHQGATQRCVEKLLENSACNFSPAPPYFAAL